MILGKIAGTIVCSVVNDSMLGSRYLLVDKTDQYGKRKGDYVVALDRVGAGYDELVLVTEGSPSRETLSTTGKPVDALIVGIIDQINEFDTVIYRK